MPRLRSSFRVLLALAPLVVTSCGGEGSGGIITGDIDPVAATVEITAATNTLTSLGHCFGRIPCGG